MNDKQKMAVITLVIVVFFGVGGYIMGYDTGRTDGYKTGFNAGVTVGESHEKVVNLYVKTHPCDDSIDLSVNDYAYTAPPDNTSEPVVCAVTKFGSYVGVSRSYNLSGVVV